MGSLCCIIYYWGGWSFYQFTSDYKQVHFENADCSLSSLPPDIPITHCGFFLLGCPIGPPCFCKEVFQSRLVKLTASLNALQGMGNAQLEATLLCSCLALAKILFILSTCPSSHIVHSIVDFNSSICRFFEFIVGRPVSNWSWQMAIK